MIERPEELDPELTKQTDAIRSATEASGAPGRVIEGTARDNSASFVVEPLLSGTRSANNLSGNKDAEALIEARTGRFAAIRYIGGKLRAIVWRR